MLTQLYTFAGRINVITESFNMFVFSYLSESHSFSVLKDLSRKGLVTDNTTHYNNVILPILQVVMVLK